MINCVIFDCDGTLVESEYLCSLGLEIKLREYNIESSALELMSRFQGVKFALVIEKLESENRIIFDSDFISSYRNIVDNLFEEQLMPCEGVHEMLETIQLPVCVASSGPMRKIRKALALTGLIKHFNDNLFSCFDINSWKPSPEIFIHAAKEMGFSINECAVVEDSPVGIAAAISAGSIPIFYNPHDSQNLAKSTKTHEINNMNELKGLLDSLCL